MLRLFQWPLNFRNATLLLLLTILVALPLSKYITSAAQILLVIVWVAEGGFKNKWHLFKNRPAIWLLILLFLWHLAGLLYTQNWQYAVQDLKIKLPLLLLPLVMGTIEPLRSDELKTLLVGFVVGVAVSAGSGLLVLSGILPIRISNYREISLFISHIRFSLLIDLSIFILFYYLFRPPVKRWIRILLVGLTLYFLVFLLFMKSLTGLVVLILGGWILAIRWMTRQSNILVKWFLTVAMVMTPLLIISYFAHQVNDFYTIHDETDYLDHQTVNGNPYWHDLDNTYIENGHFVGLYVCEPEMKTAWELRSTINYDGLDQRGQEIRYTLRRYMTSLGYRKDSVGIHRLDSLDILLIEQGFANCRYRHKNLFGLRIYELIWEIDHYKKGGNPSGHSVTQRLEYMKVGWMIFCEHPLWGVGTGDVKDAFDQKYNELNSRLTPEWRLRAHNQFLTIMIALGTIGMIVLLLSLVGPAILEKRFHSYFFLMFFLVAFLSMLNEDTLETQAGVAFFAFFYSFFTFLERNPDGTKD